MLHLSKEQNLALERMIQFIFADKEDAFILKGGAGSGKTSVVARLAEELNILGVDFATMAPTGRAARVLTTKLLQANANNKPAKTIHSFIYEFIDILTALKRR